MWDRFLAMKPGDVNPAWFYLILCGGLALGIWLQHAIARAGDSWYTRLERWLR